MKVTYIAAVLSLCAGAFSHAVPKCPNQCPMPEKAEIAALSKGLLSDAVDDHSAFIFGLKLLGNVQTRDDTLFKLFRDVPEVYIEDLLVAITSARVRKLPESLKPCAPCRKVFEHVDQHGITLELRSMLDNGEDGNEYAVENFKQFLDLRPREYDALVAVSTETDPVYAYLRYISAIHVCPEEVKPCARKLDAAPVEAEAEPEPEAAAAVNPPTCGCKASKAGDSSSSSSSNSAEEPATDVQSNTKDAADKKDEKKGAAGKEPESSAASLQYSKMVAGLAVAVALVCLL